MTATENDALAPVRSALLAEAKRYGDEELSRCRERVAEVIAEAGQRADQIRSIARAQGAAEAAGYVATERAHARRAARTVVLQAQLEQYQQLRLAAVEAIEALGHDPKYPRLRAGLAREVRERLGPRVELHESPGGGVIGQTPERRLDYSLAGFAARAIDAVAGELMLRLEAAGQP